MLNMFYKQGDETPTEVITLRVETRPKKRQRSESPQPVFKLAPLIRPELPLSTSTPLVPYEPVRMRNPEEEKRKAQAEIANILAKAAADAEAAAAAAAGSATPPVKEEPAAKKPSKPKLTKEEKEAAKEKQLQKLVSPVVVKCLSKYKDKMDHDTFKKHAKEVCFDVAVIIQILSV